MIIVPKSYDQLDQVNFVMATALSGLGLVMLRVHFHPECTCTIYRSFESYPQLVIILGIKS